MRKTTALLLSLLFITAAFGKSVTMEKASQVANKYFSANSLKSSLSIANSFSKSYEGITTYYVFNYTGGGFVVVSADDAVIPILAQSDEGFVEPEITNPSVRYWFENYSRQIAEIVASGVDNTQSVAEWNQILNTGIKSSMADVAPLLSITWDQTGYYNYYCPIDVTGPAGKTYVGCVATAMGQIMKYYNFPATGVGSHSYTDGKYGLQSADFGATSYNFGSMGNSATSLSYLEIAKLLYHAGVSVNMAYGTDATDGSGAFSEDVPGAMTKYFNYDNSTIKQAYSADYTSVAWIALLKTELDAHRPLYYSGSGDAGGHAWVCDGYRNSDNMFHMNWGWSGSANGYYAIGTLNPSSYKFNTGNAVVYGIKPGNPDLIVRFTDLEDYNSVTAGPSFDIKCSVVKGAPTAVKLFIDNRLVYTTTQTSFSYAWNTSAAALGTYVIRVEAINALDTVYQEANIGLSEWISQNTAFTSPFRYISNIHAVDSLVVWAIASDNDPVLSTQINEITKTSDGGATWTPGKVLGGTVYGLGNICGINKDVAFVSVFSTAAQDNTCGIYKTSNGGTTWTQLPGALQGASSFADNVWFWNENEGMCHGDVDASTNCFEIYTTANGGTTWNRVPKANIGAGADAASGEGGWTSVIQAVGDNTVMFGTNMGNLYISHDKGLNWVISNTGITPVTSGVQKICFKDELNGLVIQTTTATVLRETHDGGTTWQTIKPLGPFQKSDLAFVPGTDNTFVSVGSGASYSFDGGHSWSQAGGTEFSAFPSVAFVNNSCGWAGGGNNSSLQKGIFKYNGTLVPASVRNPVTKLTAEAIELTALVKWTAPVIAPISYNIYRNDTLIKNTTDVQYLDSPVSKGRQEYCVTSVYYQGESTRSCATTTIALGIVNPDDASYKVYPNPANEIINITTPVKFNEVRMINSLGKVVYSNNTRGTNLHILTEGLNPGIYILLIYTGTQVNSKKVLISR
ncbi:MAG: C10 family peptidase [Lentimicrobiaceae bacterium]|jgi:hypothetical protein